MVDTQGLVLGAKVHNSARIMDREGIKLLLGPVQERLPPLAHLWLDAAYNGENKGKDWVEKALGWTAEIVRHPPKMAPSKIMELWIREWLREGTKIDWEKLSPPRRFGGLPRRWVIERTFSWLGQNRRMRRTGDYTFDAGTITPSFESEGQEFLVTPLDPQ